ncbi:MAG: hypothetical protein A2V79_09675 [Betaproteobacteria bacterium RBG_16_56_24]|nr:MAG: hypothetical protein A2V79_09675 [Betaproteobacteria bacterium RBG_16_56_24]
MIRLVKALRAWGTPDFKATLKHEIESKDAEQLPLQQGLTFGNYVIANQHTAMINSVSEAENLIRVTAGIFYKSVIGGCSCTDDPTPINEIEEYCEVLIEIDKATAETTIALQSDSFPGQSGQ